MTRRSSIYARSSKEPVRQFVADVGYTMTPTAMVVSPKRLHGILGLEADEKLPEDWLSPLPTCDGEWRAEANRRARRVYRFWESSEPFVCLLHDCPPRPIPPQAEGT